VTQQRVLISNRGEIAVRIAKAVRGLGMLSIGVSTAADRQCLHLGAVDETYELPGDAIGGYLDVTAIIATAKAARATHIHPGYGFLSENAQFASACAREGIVFIGPTPTTLQLFGDKVAARRFVSDLGIAILPGTDRAVASAESATEAADRFGYPVMMKASAGGGGRGMRAVHSHDEAAEAFARCTSEATSSFGNGDVFVEKLVTRPRHIEVQVVGDGTTYVHLYERDCSIQIRNQKVIEIAPAPNLDPALRQRLLNDAVSIARASNYVGVGTVEFLVDPTTGEHWFIECNPRVQVEHTITEQVTGVDIVELQLNLATGNTLATCGIVNQSSVPAPRGFAVQARVVATGPGTMHAYKEPSGPRVRVDACGYLGYTPPPQFDPLFAKIIAQSGSDASLSSALNRTSAALGEFHIIGLPTNIGLLLATLSSDAVRGGDARTTLFAEQPDLLTAATQSTTATIFLGDHAPDTQKQRAEPSRTLPITASQKGVRVPMTSSVIDVRFTVGDPVRRGDVLVVVSAMKMETPIEAPCDGRIVAMLPLAVGETVDLDRVIAVIEPGSVGSKPVGAPTSTDRTQTWEPVLDEVRTLQRLAEERLGPNSTEPGVVRQRNRSKLTCRERIRLLLDDNSFREIGSAAGFATYGDNGIEAFTPANHVGGHGMIDDRQTIVCADDFTSRGGHADGAIATKSTYLDRLSIELRVPSIRLLDGSSGGGSVAAMVPEQRKVGESTAMESSGAITAGQPRVAGTGGSFLPGHLGSSMYTEQLSTVPVVNVLMGSVVGLGAAKAVLGHFSVMVKDIAQLFVAGPPVVSHAMGYEVTKEDLGGWQIHCRNGSVDNLAETEADAITMTKRFLSYLPSSSYELPPVRTTVKDKADRHDDELATLIPRKRTTTFDVRRAITLLADLDSFFEIGPLWGTDQVVGLVRMDGHPMGVIASDSRHINGGALTADGCDKVKRLIDLCDLFHLPILNLVDNPGFAVGIDHEIAGTIRKGGEWMVAFAQARVPLFTVIMRRSFGVAGNNWATPQANPSMRVVWPSADVGGIPPEGGIEAAYKRQLAESADPAALRAEIQARIESARGPLGPLSKFQVEEMIDPRNTRALVCGWVTNAYRILSHPNQLGPKHFRP
jgi:acetyl/propionyl-CoA carboxylase alpha subunit/acetyl-CoA carboxylase carboxyltransferase component